MFTSLQYTSAQKPVVDMELLKNWKDVTDGVATSDGKFMYYSVNSGLTKVLYIKSLKNKWEKKFAKIKKVYLTNNNRYVLFEQNNDSISVLELGYEKVLFSVSGTDLKKNGDKTFELFSWMCRDSSGTSKLTVWDPRRNHKLTFNNAVEILSNKENIAIISFGPTENHYSLIWMSLITGKNDLVWEGLTRPKSCTFNLLGSKLAFFVDDVPSTRSGINIVILQKNGMREVLTDSSSSLKNNYLIDDRYLAYNKHDVLFFSVEPISDVKDNESQTEAVSVDIWHYKDRILQSQQLSNLLIDNVMLLAIYDCRSKLTHVLPLNEDQKYLVDFASGQILVDSFLLVQQKLQKPNELQFDVPGREESFSNISLLNIFTGEEKRVISNKYLVEVKISPAGNFIIFYDRVKKEYYCYQRASGETIAISSKIPYTLSNRISESEKKPFSTPCGIATWLVNDQEVLLYDQFDIWQVDPKGRRPPNCITKGYGRKNNIQLRLQYIEGVNNQSEGLKRNEEVILKGASIDNYQEGFQKIFIGRDFAPNIKLFPYKNRSIQKFGRNYLISRSSNSQPLNWYLTTNLSEFKQCSFIELPTEYNLYTKELVAFKTLDGINAKGLLYKPADFNPSKRYPIIFKFYESSSENYYEFESPRLSTGPIDPVWFASRGYLIFVPDISYKFGIPGESVYNAVMGAADKLCENNWVDSTKMGLSGGSQGGFAVNYLVTRTNRFVAAAAANGVVNMISGYNALRETGFSRQYIYETSQSRIGATLWEKPELYIKNSAIFYADKVNTPVLIMHNKDDKAVPWSQGVEWFLALRRLGKRCWMLQYDNEGHGVYEEKAAVDYALRLEQFFNHYLKGNKMPVWMTQGIPAKLKGIDSGLELDTSGAQP